MLLQFVTAVCRDVVFRRALRYQPAQALRTWELEPESVPETLPVRHYEVSANFDDEVLFGADEVDHSGPLTLPLEARMVLYGLKPMALLQTSAAQAARLVRICASYNLHAILSHYEFTPVADPSANGYFNVSAERRPRVETRKTGDQ